MSKTSKTQAKAETTRETDEATPRPWGEDSRWRRCVVSPNGIPDTALSLVVVAQCVKPGDAALIIRAVNAHDKLVRDRDALLAACRALVRAWENGERLHHGDPNSFADPIGMARAAITAAKGGAQ